MELVSIHAPREGRDDPFDGLPRLRRVSIHAPREGRDEIAEVEVANVALFQSTRPVKGATLRAAMGDDELWVSIHAPREGRDLPSCADGQIAAWFQSTRPVKGATCPAAAPPGRCWRFNPRAP